MYVSQFIAQSVRRQHDVDRTNLAMFGKSFINIARSDVGRVALFLSRRRGPQHLLLAPDLIVALNVLAQSAVVFFEYF